MNRSLTRALLLAAMTALPAISVGASPLPVPVLDDQSTSSATKKTTANPKKPAAAKSTTDADKIKTDERMSTRGLKPPPKDANKDKTAKPDAKSTPESANPK
jgi:hypothetical protein